MVPLVAMTLTDLSSLELSNAALYTQDSISELVARIPSAGPHSITGCYSVPLGCNVTTNGAGQPSHLCPTNQLGCTASLAVMMHHQLAT